MRYAIFSDVHSNLEALEAVIKAYKLESIDKYLCIGDVVGYGTDVKECVKKVKALAGVCVAGNHDWASVNLFSLEHFNPQAKEAVVWTKRYLDEESKYFLEALRLIYKDEDLTLVHGTLDNPQDFKYMVNGYDAWESFQLLKTNVCFIGHTHIAGVFKKDKGDNVYYMQEREVNVKDGNSYVVNVGSVGQPRDGNPDAGFCVYDTETGTVRIKRVKYDARKTRDKIIKAGLPADLGDRLLIGK